MGSPIDNGGPFGAGLTDRHTKESERGTLQPTFSASRETGCARHCRFGAAWVASMSVEGPMASASWPPAVYRIRPNIPTERLIPTKHPLTPPLTTVDLARDRGPSSLSGGRSAGRTFTAETGRAVVKATLAAKAAASGLACRRWQGCRCAARMSPVRWKIPVREREIRPPRHLPVLRVSAVKGSHAVSPTSARPPAIRVFREAPSM
jgi:hypothetical protein